MLAAPGGAVTTCQSRVGCWIGECIRINIRTGPKKKNKKNVCVCVCVCVCVYVHAQVYMYVYGYVYACVYV